jgi:cytochrome c oxidase subunit 2
VAIAVAGCLPSPATDRAKGIDALYAGFVIAAALVALSVVVPVTIAIVRFRRRPGDGLPAQTHGSEALEIGWTVAAGLVVLALFVGTAVVQGQVEAVGHDDPAAVEIDVTAFRWGWRFTYPANGVTVSGSGVPGPQVPVPIGTPLTIRLDAVDVIHSFYVPLFLFKRDAIPGRTNVFQFTVDDVGSYRGQCAEFCGIGHSRMMFTIEAMSRADFDAWSTRAAASPSSAP